MPNGIHEKLDYEKLIGEMSGLKGDELLKFVARQVLLQGELLTATVGEVKKNTVRSWINRYVLLALILVLTILGILDPKIFYLLGK